MPSHDMINAGPRLPSLLTNWHHLLWKFPRFGAKSSSTGSRLSLSMAITRGGKTSGSREATAVDSRRRAGIATKAQSGPAAAAAPALPSQKRATAVQPAAAAAAPAAVAAPAAAAPAAAPAVEGLPALREPSPAAPQKLASRPKPPAAPSLDPSRLEEVRQKAARITEVLQRLYPDPPIPLDHSSHFQLLCAVVLSAQTTDKKVNEVTPALFKLAPDAASMAGLEVEAIVGCIRQLGLAPTKAKNLKSMSQMLLELHGGQVPDSFEALEALPGVGHKTASVVMAQCFGHAAFPVDTHIHRLAQRWGLTAGKSVEQTEADLKLAFPERLWRALHLQIIFFGREECPARGHDPAACPICSFAAVPPYDRAGHSPLKPGRKAGSSSGGEAKRRTSKPAVSGEAGQQGRGGAKRVAGSKAVPGPKKSKQ